jgi:hypothetical protein
MAEKKQACGCGCGLKQKTNQPAPEQKPAEQPKNSK